MVVIGVAGVIITLTLRKIGAIVVGVVVITTVATMAIVWVIIAILTGTTLRKTVFVSRETVTKIIKNLMSVLIMANVVFVVLK